MTYGDNAAAIRDELAALLGYHRIQQRLAAPGRRTPPEMAAPTERLQLGQTIRRYRDVTLLWCRTALVAVSPKTDPHTIPYGRRTPVEELRYRLDRNITPQFEQPPLVELLATDHQVELVTRWQRMARAATLGEHDFGVDVNLGHLTNDQARTVTRDAADIIRGLLVLDRRYQNTPGWPRLYERGRVIAAAEAVSRQSHEVASDASVDRYGWRPTLGLITGPALPGVAGAVQAQHNTLVELAHHPNALNLRRLLHSQAQASHEAAQHAAHISPELTARFTDRAQTYRTLVADTRNLGGLLGGGGQAVAHSHNAVDRLRRASYHPSATEALRDLGRLFTRTDTRLATTIERGLDQKLYHVARRDAPIPGSDELAARRLTHWQPAADDLRGTLVLPLAAHPGSLSSPSPPPQAATASRRHYEAMLSHQQDTGRSPTYGR